MLVIAFLLFCSTACYAQDELTSNLLTERIGNFSIELIHHTYLDHSGKNMIISPISVWTELAVISEGAAGDTKLQIEEALRLPKNKTVARMKIAEASQLFKFGNLDAINVVEGNNVLIDSEVLTFDEFHETARTNGIGFLILPFDYMDIASVVNSAISKVTRGQIPSLVRSTDFKDAMLLLYSALIFKGKWKIPFNSTITRKQPFYDSYKNQIGEVNMMFSRASYPFAEVKDLQARVVELPIGEDNRLSMLIMLPNYGVSLLNMFSNFKRLSLRALFDELRPLVDDFTHNEVELRLPRFKINSNLDMTLGLNRMGIRHLFDANYATLPLISSTPNLFASKLVHIAEIDVTEEGTAAQEENTEEEFSNRVGEVWFEVNRPFTYMIVEKKSDTIIFGGFYLQPSLY